METEIEIEIENCGTQLEQCAKCKVEIEMKLNLKCDNNGRIQFASDGSNRAEQELYRQTYNIIDMICRLTLILREKNKNKNRYFSRRN